MPMPKNERKPRYLRAETRERPTGVNEEEHIIRGASVIKGGEALGHGMWIDNTFLDQVVAAGKARESGLKARYDHPTACSSSVGQMLGRWQNFRRDGNRVRADLHLLESSAKSPNGDLRTHVEKLALEDPEMFGISIVFDPDRGEQNRFADKHMDKDGNFTSPDPDNTNNLLHARLASLFAADVVDEPAANEDGLFGIISPAGEASRYLDAMFGLSEEPELLSTAMGIRIQEFLSSWQAHRGVKLEVKKENQMPEQQKTEAEQTPVESEAKPKDGEKPVDPKEETQEITPPVPPETPKAPEQNSAQAGQAKTDPPKQESQTPAQPDTASTAKPEGLSNKQVIEICEKYNVPSLAKNFVDLNLSENDLLAELLKSGKLAVGAKPEPLVGSASFQSLDNDHRWEKYGKGFAKHLPGYIPETEKK